MRGGDLGKPHVDPGAGVAILLPDSLVGRDPSFRRRMESLIEKVVGLDPGEVHSAARLRDDFAVDFLDLLELALAMEAEIGVRIPDRALKEVTTVDDLIRIAGEALAVTPENVAFRAGQQPRPFRQRVRRSARTR
jgi:acyl carrier protein